MSLFDKLPLSLIFGKNQASEEYFFALNIGSDFVEGAVWGIDGDKLKIINITSAPIKNDLIEASNIALDLSLADFEPEPNKVLFGVPDSWLQDETLKKEHVEALKDLTKNLDVAPLAYVSTSHSITHLLQKTQGIPITAVLVENSDPLNVTVVKAGKIISTKSAKRSGSFPEDIEKALLAFSEVEVLPSKILIFGKKEKNEEAVKDELHSYPWMQNLPFLHVPKIEILKEKIAIAAVCFAGACEINPGAVFSEHTLEKFEKDSQTDTVASALTFSTEEGKPLDKKEAKDFNLDKAGFISGDIEEKEKVSGDNFDLEENLPPETTDRGSLRREASERYGDERQPSYHGEKNLVSSIQQTIFAPFKSVVPFIKPPEGKFGFLKKGFIIPTLLILALILFYIFIPKAKVTVFIDPRILEKEAEVVVDPSVSSIDEENSKIPGKSVSVTLSGVEKGVATGKKQVGESAKGSVNIYNLTSNKVNLSQGTLLTGPSSLKFELDSSVSIASQSSTIGADFTTVTTPGKANVEVSASNIGPESNLAAGTSLSVAGYSDSQVIAKVDSALSGGTSKDVTIVTSDDQKKLLALASGNLRKKAREKLSEQITDDLKILEEGLAESNVSASYSKKVNDQATEFNLNLSVTYKGTAYSDADLKTMVSKLVQTNVPEGYMLNLQDAETQADVAKVDPDGKVIFLAKFRAKLMPKLDVKKIKNDLAGKTPEQSVGILKQIENVISSEIKITPSMPFFLNRIPFLKSNISVDVKAK